MLPPIEQWVGVYRVEERTHRQRIGQKCANPLYDGPTLVEVPEPRLLTLGYESQRRLVPALILAPSVADDVEGWRRISLLTRHGVFQPLTRRDEPFDLPSRFYGCWHAYILQRRSLSDPGIVTQDRTRSCNGRSQYNEGGTSARRSPAVTEVRPGG